MKTPRIHDFDPAAAERKLGTPLDGMPTIQKPAASNHAPAAVSEKPQPSPVEAPVQTQTQPTPLASEQRLKKIPHSTLFSRSYDQRKPVSLLEPKHGGALAYDLFAEWLIKYGQT